MRLDQTFSKSPRQWPANAPRAIVRGRAGHVWDASGREFIDTTLGLGPVVLGYRDRDVERAVRCALRDGPIFSLRHPIEDRVADMLTEVIPCAEDGLVKYGLHGSDATTAAVRAARAFTGRDFVASYGYHGWHDWTCPNRAGVPGEDHHYARTFSGDWRLGEWTRHADLYAAVIIEPEYMEGLGGLREFCSWHGVVLIFDEVLTGFRVALGGYQQHVGVIPDLACFSKALGNGYPVSCVVGKREIMETFAEVGISGTFLGWTPGLAAAAAVIAKMRAQPVIETLWQHGRDLKEAFGTFAKASGVKAELRGLPPRMTVHFVGDQALDPILGPSVVPWRTLWAQEMIRGGVLANFGLTMCYAHTEADIYNVGVALREAFKVLGSVDDPRERLGGEPAQRSVRAT